MAFHRSINRLAILIAGLLMDLSLAGVGGTTRAEVQGNANRLIDYLFRNYTTLIRPRVNQSETVRVQFDIAMKQVIDVDVKTQQMTLFLWQRQTWIDDFLAWNPKDFGGIDQLFISPTKIWVSDVIFQNSVDEFEQLKDTTIIKALVLHSGQVYFFRPTLKSTTCKMSVRYFPYDSQVCSFQVGSWMLSEDQVDIQILAFDSAVSGFVTHHEWHLAERSTFRCSLTLPVNVGTLQKNMTFPFLEFLFLFQRKPEFFEKNLIVPTALICALSIVAFLLPNESGEKIGFSITVFLSLCVNLVVITSYVPASSESFPIIGQYYLTCIFLVAVSIVLTTCILSVHYFGDQYFIKPLPKPVKKVFFEILAPMVGMQCLKRCSSCIASNILPTSSNRKAIPSRLTHLKKTVTTRNNHVMQRKNNDRATCLGALKGKNASTVLRNSKISANNHHVDALIQLNSSSFYSDDNYAPTQTNPYTSSPYKKAASLTNTPAVDHKYSDQQNHYAKASNLNDLSHTCNHSTSALFHPNANECSAPVNGKKLTSARNVQQANDPNSQIGNVTTSFLVLPQHEGSASSGSVADDLNVVSNHMNTAQFGEKKQNRRSSVNEMSRSVSPATLLDETTTTFNLEEPRGGGRSPSHASYGGLVSSFDDLKRSLVKIEHYLETVAKANEKKKKKCITIEEWKLLSRILDRIFAIAYGLTTLLLTCYFFVQAKSGEVQLAKECFYTDE